MKNDNMILYLLINALVFYIFPFIIDDSGTAKFTLLIAIPVITFIVAIAYGMNNPFNILYMILVALLFYPSIWIHYNESASVYMLVYGVIAVIGNSVGHLLRKVKIKK